MVIAETAAQAVDAAEKVAVDYEELPHVTSTAAAAEPGAPAVWDEVPDNVFIETKFGDWEATDAAFAKADHVIRADFHIDRVTAVTIEPRSSLGYASSQISGSANAGQKRQSANRLANSAIESVSAAGNEPSRASHQAGPAISVATSAVYVVSITK